MIDKKVLFGNMKMAEEISYSELWVMTISPTGRCNANCSYCHYYQSNKRTEVNRDMDDELFGKYVQLLKTAINNNLEIAVRFSGGEPLLLSDRLFDMINIVYMETGIHPYILTNGLLVDNKIINKAKSANAGGIVISMENPFRPDPGAPDPFKIIDKVREFNSDDLPVLPGLVIVRNSEYKNILNICDWFFEKCGQIPCINELSYMLYETPSEQDLRDLDANVRAAIRKYFGKTRMDFFPMIIPECYTGSQRRFSIDLGLSDKYSARSRESAEVLSDIISDSYYYYISRWQCHDKSCDWFDNCYVKYPFWTSNSSQVSLEQKKIDYCKYKKLLLNIFYDELTNSDV